MGELKYYNLFLGIGRLCTQVDLCIGLDIVVFKKDLERPNFSPWLAFRLSGSKK